MLKALVFFLLGFALAATLTWADHQVPLTPGLRSHSCSKGAISTSARCPGGPSGPSSRTSASTRAFAGGSGTKRTATEPSGVPLALSQGENA